MICLLFYFKDKKKWFREYFSCSLTIQIRKPQAFLKGYNTCAFYVSTERLFRQNVHDNSEPKIQCHGRFLCRIIGFMDLMFVPSLNNG